ncbi:MAG: VanZ family protein [Rhodobacteraceae bacterium]|nr:VanZ family protein [Paracoccaceae bacterium]
MKPLAYGLTAILVVTIAWLTLTPQDLPQASGGDKLHHLIAFAALCLPIAATNRRAVIWLAPVAMLFGGAIELIQPYVNRSGEWADAGADALGVMIGVALGLFIGWIFRKTSMFSKGKI